MAQISKQLPIRSHDSKADRGRATGGQRLAAAAYASASMVRMPVVRGQLKQTLGALVDREQAKGTMPVNAAIRQRRAVREQRVLAARSMVDPVARMKRETQLATEKFAHELRRSQVVAPRQGPNRKQTQQRRLTNLHNAHVQAAMLSAMRPLRQGVTASTVMQAMGTMAAMYVFSPHVRAVVHSFKPPMLGAITDRIQGRRETERRDPKISARLDNKALDKLDAAGGDRSSLSEKWQRRLDHMQQMKPGDREPYTAQTAAMVRIGLAESAYTALRDNSVPLGARAAHQADVLASYDSAMGVMNEWIQADGLDQREVDQAMRMMVGARLEREPQLASVFNELGHGRFVKAPARMAMVKGKSKPQMVWDGAFTDAVTDQEVNLGAFTLRMPGDRAEHLDQCTATLKAELEDAKSLTELNEMFASYTAASVVRQYPDLASDVDDPAMSQRMGRAATMFASMRADGVSQADQRFVYAAAFVDAMEQVGQDKPELLAQWEGQYGPDWREGLRETVQIYSDLGADAEDAALVQALVERGFGMDEAAEEVEALRAEHDRSPDAGPMVPERSAGAPEPGTVPAPGEFDTRLPRRSSVPVPAVLLDRMGDWVADDLQHEADRAGWYDAEGTRLMGAEGAENERYVDSSEALASAMGEYLHMDSQLRQGRIMDPDEQLTSSFDHRAAQLAAMDRALEQAGVGTDDRPQMMAAAYVSGLEKLVAREPFRQLAIESASLRAGATGSDWRQGMYERTLSSLRVGSVNTPVRDYAHWDQLLDQFDDARISGRMMDEAQTSQARSQARDAAGTAAQQVGERVSEARQARTVRPSFAARLRQRVLRRMAERTNFEAEQVQAAQSDGPELGG